MRALLRADWLRLRRRKDLLIIGIAVLVLSGVTFLAAYRSDVADPEFPNEAQVRQEILGYVEFGGMTQAEIDIQIDEMVAQQVASYEQERVSWDARQQIALQKYDGLQSIFTIIGGGLMPILALVLGASLALGDEFRFGTIRTSLLAASNRRRFLGTRLISYVTMTIGLFGLLAFLGLGLGVGLRIVGAEVAATVTPLDPVSSLAWLGAQVLITMTLIAVAVALTVLLRSGALPLLLILIASLMELFIANLPVFYQGETLAAVPQAFPTTSMRTLTTILGFQSHAAVLAEAQAPTLAIDLPMFVVAGIVAAWGLLFLVIADRRIRTMDVTE